MRQIIILGLCCLLLSSTLKSQKSEKYKFSKVSIAIWDNKSREFNRNYPFLDFDVTIEFKKDSSIILGTKEVNAAKYKYTNYKWHEKEEKTNSSKTLKWDTYYLVQDVKNEYVIIDLIKDKDDVVTSVELINFKAIVIYSNSEK